MIRIRFVPEMNPGKGIISALKIRTPLEDGAKVKKS
jgi:hypothetical protein